MSKSLHLNSLGFNLRATSIPSFLCGENDARIYLLISVIPGSSALHDGYAGTAAEAGSTGFY